MKDDRVYLNHIIECLDAIADFTAEGKEHFLADRKTQSSVLRELQTLAESTQRLSTGLKDLHPETPWSAISGLRNILVHDYLGINLERIWEIVERDLPALRKAVEGMKKDCGRT